MKPFAVIERFIEHVYTNVCSKANSANATKFLRELIENVPYQVCSIQAYVDKLKVSSICSTPCKTNIQRQNRAK